MACVAHYFQMTGSMKASGDTSISMNACSVLDQQTYHLLRKVLEFIFKCL